MFGDDDRARQELAERLTASRLACNLSQDEVAGYLRRSRFMVSRHERIWSEPSFTHLRKYGMLYGVSLDWLAYGVVTAPVGGPALQDIFRQREAAQCDWPGGL